MARVILGTLVAGLLAAPVPVAAQKVQVQPDQYYLVLEVMKLATLEQELNDAAQHGFRLVLSTTSDDGQRIQALMERLAEPPEVFHYRLVATAEIKTGDREMNAAGLEGYRAIPHTSMVKKGFTVFNTNRVVVMEKAPSSTTRFTYLTLNAIRTDTFHKQLRATVDEGWRVLDMMYGQILLEREAMAPSTPSLARR